MRGFDELEHGVMNKLDSPNQSEESKDCKSVREMCWVQKKKDFMRRVSNDQSAACSKEA